MLCEGLRAASPHKVPNLHRAVAGGRGEQIAFGVELNATDPVDMAFTAHDQVAVGDRPELPRGVITSRGDDVLFRVVAERRDTHEVTLERLAQRQM